MPPTIVLKVSTGATASILDTAERVYAKAHIPVQSVPGVGERAYLLTIPTNRWPTQTLGFLQHGVFVALDLDAPAFSLERAAAVAATLSAALP
jgi:hypothetical protein